MPCEKVKSKKYKSRKSPPYHAGDCKGKVLKGNDGAQWKSVSDSRRIFKWTLLTQANKTRKMLKGKSYETHDNGARPFLVIDNPSKKEIEVMKQEYNKEKDKYEPVKKVYSTKYKEIFIGSGGSSILVKQSTGKNSYVFIGHEIKEFETEDKIIKFESPVGNNDIPYPYAIGEKFTYFILENVYVPNSVLDVKKNYYGQIYGHIENKELEKEKKQMKKKILVKREF